MFSVQSLSEMVFDTKFAWAKNNNVLLLFCCVFVYLFAFSRADLSLLDPSMRVSIEILEQLTFLNDLPFEMTIIRNGFGITPKGPMGPFPVRAPKAPLGPPWARYPP